MRIKKFLQKMQEYYSYEYMMDIIDAGNIPMVGMTVDVAVAIEEASK